MTYWDPPLMEGSRTFGRNWWIPCAVFKAVSYWDCCCSILCPPAALDSLTCCPWVWPAGKYRVEFMRACTVRSCIFTLDSIKTVNTCFCFQFWKLHLTTVCRHVQILDAGFLQSSEKLHLLRCRRSCSSALCFQCSLNRLSGGCSQWRHQQSFFESSPESC